MKRKVSAVISQNCVSPAIKKAKLAQRKFAHGANNNGFLPQKVVKTFDNVSPEIEDYEFNNFPCLPTVDDFLTFLCFRETKVLPERLNYLYSPQLDTSHDNNQKRSSPNHSVSTPINIARQDEPFERKPVKYKQKLKNNITQISQNTSNIKTVICKAATHSLTLKHNQRIRSKNKIFGLQDAFPLRSIHPSNCEFKRKSLRQKIPKKLDDYDTSSGKRVTKRCSTQQNSSDVLSCHGERLSRPKFFLPTLKIPSCENVSKNQREVMSSRCTRSSSVQPDETPMKKYEKTTRLSQRPTRRTKEKAVLYMEMLGKELLKEVNNLDDDDVANFPELPSTSELMKIEKEFSEHHEKKCLDMHLINPEWSRSKFNPIKLPKPVEGNTKVNLKKKKVKLNTKQLLANASSGSSVSKYKDHSSSTNFKTTFSEQNATEGLSASKVGTSEKSNIKKVQDKKGGHDVSTSDTSLTPFSIIASSKSAASDSMAVELSPSANPQNQVFYIPIPTSTPTGTLGVAVKLGTDGSSQKFIMSATLVTNTSTFTSSTLTNVSAKSQVNIPSTNASFPKLSHKKIVTAEVQNGKKEIKALPVEKSKTQLVKIVKLRKSKKIVSAGGKMISTSPDSKCRMVVKKDTENKIFLSSASSASASTDSSQLSNDLKKNSVVKKILAGSSISLIDTSNVSIGTIKDSVPLISSRDIEKEHVNHSAILNKSSNVPVKILKVNKNNMNNLSQRATTSEVEIVTLETNKNESSKTLSPAEEVVPVVQEQIIEAPTFYPSEQEFEDPLEYIEKIRIQAEKYGLCRIIPPSTFKPECKVSDGMRFTAYNQYVHKMLNRWGPNVKELMAMHLNLSDQNIQWETPKIGGMEVDVPRLYRTVQQCGGLKSVIEKDKWQMVADRLKISKHVHDRITKLDEIYCKYVLPYDTLSRTEREKLSMQSEEKWRKHLEDITGKEVTEDIDKCIVKGRTMDLGCFYRMARNTMHMNFGISADRKSPSTKIVEEEFWNHVSDRKDHVCVQYGSIDSGTEGYGFSMAKNSTIRTHPWNLKVLTNNPGSILRSLGSIMGLTVPIIYVGMLYSTCCWYRDPHGLSWVEYLHTGANKVWYGVSDENSEKFKNAMLKIAPRFCRDKKIWLPADTVVVPPTLLTAEGVPLARVVQEPGQFIVVFPKAFTSSVSTGYLVSEIVYFAQTSWFDFAEEVFEDMHDSGEPPVFSLEQMLLSVAQDTRTNISALNKVLPMLVKMREIEMKLRKQLRQRGVKNEERLQRKETDKLKTPSEDPNYYECDTCHANLFVSMVRDVHDQSDYCLKHAVILSQKKPSVVKYWTLLYFFSEVELDDLITKVKSEIGAKSSKH